MEEKRKKKGKRKSKGKGRKSGGKRKRGKCRGGIGSEAERKKEEGREYVAVEFW